MARINEEKILKHPEKSEASTSTENVANHYSIIMKVLVGSVPQVQHNLEFHMWYGEEKPPIQE